MPYGWLYLEPRGSREIDTNHQLDLKLSKGLGIGPVNVELIAAVFNLFSSEKAAAVCQFSAGCGDIETGAPTEWQLPRRYELGVRVEF